jgi:PAS domain S-box-containing protein
LGLGYLSVLVVLVSIRLRSRNLAEEAERALSDAAENDRRWRDIFELSPVGYIESDGDATVVRANRLSHTILGRAPDTLVGFNLADLGLATAFGQGQPVWGGSTELTYTHPDGQELRLLVHRSEVRRGARSVGMLTALTDVTALRRAEREREELRIRFQQSQRLETIGTLAGGIAHDFNNLLVPIQGYTEFAHTDLPEDHPVQEDLEQIQQATERAKELVQQILQFSRPEKEDRRPLHLQDVVREATGLLRASLPTTIAIDHRVDVSCPPIFGKSTQIHQVLFNLCTNAAHAMPDGGTITVSVDLVDVLTTRGVSRRPKGDGPFVRLCVIDRGTGMDEETRQRLFEPFFTTKAPGQGSGLGLSMVQGIVTAFDGTISVDSAPGVGSTFTVLFPVYNDLSALEQSPMALDEVRGEEHILVVDDDHAVLKVTARGLARFGYQVTTFQSSREALDAFRAMPSSFDLVLTDQTMPELTGLSLAEAMLRERPDIPILLSTGNASSLTRAEVMEAGCAELLFKPVTPSTLARAVAKVLRAGAAA